MELSGGGTLSLGTPLDPPKAHLGAPQGSLSPPKNAPGHPGATSNSQSWHARNLGNITIWPPGVSKKRSRATFRASEYPPETLQSGDPSPPGCPRAPKKLPGGALGPPKDPPGPPQAPLEHPHEFQPGNFFIENQRLSDFTRFSNLFYRFSFATIPFGIRLCQLLHIFPTGFINFTNRT